MAWEVRGHAVVVTGASSGIGSALARVLVSEGARVVAVARSEGRLRSLAAELGPALCPVPADVTDERAVERVARQAWQECGAVDIVVNNAGVGHLEAFLDSCRERWQEAIDTNLFGPLLMARAFLPAMLAAGRGLVVNVGSTGRSGWPYMALYGASKAALHAATVALDREFGPRGVRLVAVDVGSTMGTEFGAGFGPEEMQRAAGRWTELGISWCEPLSTPEDSAATILQAIRDAPQ